MRNSVGGPVAALLLAMGLAAPALRAQGERITLRPAPAPNQVIRIGMSQELMFDITVEGMAAAPMTVEGTTTFQGTQRVGPKDAHGRVTARFTWDSVALKMMLNGNPFPGVPDLGGLEGRTMSIVYGPDGRVEEVTTPPEVGAAGDRMKQMLTTLLGRNPTATLAVGDTASVAYSLPVPLPVPGADPAHPLTLDGRILYKLVGVAREGTDRIATLEQTMDMKSTRTIDMPMSGGTVPVPLDLRMTGGGSLRINVDKGFVRSGATQGKIDMTMGMPAGTVRMQGTIHVNMSGESRPGR